MSEHPNAVFVKAIWKAVAEADAEVLQNLFTKDLVWHASGRGRWHGTYTGRDKVLELLANVGELAEELRSELKDIFVNDERAVLLYRLYATRGKDTLATDMILIVEIRDGQATEIWSIAADQHAYDEFWQ